MEDKQYYLSPDLTHRLAAIDIGSNSLRLIVAEAMRGGTYRVLDEEKETTRLAGKLSSTGKLDPEAVDKAIAALGRMKRIAEGFQVRDLRCIATCAVREAKDGDEFCRRVKDEVGLNVEVISDEQEAHLAFSSVARAFPLDKQDVAVADLGGGSTELVLASGNIIEAVCSTPLGAVRLTEMFADENGMIGHDFPKMIAWIDRELRRRTKDVLLRPHVLIGSGGTFTAVAVVVQLSKGQTGLPMRGYEVTRAEISHLLDRVRKMSPKARRNLPGLSPDRADIITAGLAIIDRLMAHFQVNRVQIHDRGVRDGLLMTMLEQAVGPVDHNAHEQAAAVEQFAVNCGTDLAHGRHVAQLAGSMLSQLVGKFGLTAEDRPLLETAARLQDVGYLINYDQHHKHSYHLILNSRLPGFRPHELEIIANVARYHRGSDPKKKHDNFGRLSKADRGRVRKLAGILRIAGGLDRSNSRQVQGVQLTVCPEQITFRVDAAVNPDVDLWAAEKRAKLFEKAFGAETSFVWNDPNAAASSAEVVTESELGPAGGATPLGNELAVDGKTETNGDASANGDASVSGEPAEGKAAEFKADGPKPKRHRIKKRSS